jgi:hypothetical protein
MNDVAWLVDDGLVLDGFELEGFDEDGAASHRPYLSWHLFAGRQ